jgi:hypothetical protein
MGHRASSLLLSLVLFQPVLAQGDPPTPDELLKEALKKTSEEAPFNAKLEEALGKVLTRDVTTTFLAEKTINEPTRMWRAVNFCEGLIQRFYDDKVKNLPLQAAFHKRMQEEIARILFKPGEKKIVLVNLTRVLSLLASNSGNEETADSLVKVITEPTLIDGARYYACQGLKGLMAHTAKKGLPTIKDATRRTEVVTALIAFIERKMPYTPNTPEESEGLRVLRREAIRALAESRVAQIPGQANGHAALTLAKVVGKDKSLAPEPRIDERVEAAIGLCRLPADPKDLQAGYLGYLIGELIKDFGRGYQLPPERKYPQKIYAARLLDALSGMAATHDDPTVKTVANLGAVILTDMERNTQPKPDQLGDWLKANPPAQRAVYKSDAKSVVTP